MFWIFGRKKDAVARVHKALTDHVGFEAAHVSASHPVYEKNPHAAESLRSVPIGPGEFLVRKIGQYDRDQKIERILGEVTKSYFLERRTPPKYLRKLVERAVP